MILATSFLLWAILAAGFGLAARTLAAGALGNYRRRLTAAILLLAAGALLLRPEEELFIGEDPGAYINSALAFHRHGGLFYQDPALATLEDQEWRAFRYGHDGFYPSKDNCLHIRDGSRGLLGPWFQPAYALLLAMPISLGFPYLAFFVTPLLAIGAGILVAGLAWRLTGIFSIACGAFGLFIMHPVVIWNARGFRAEVPATLMILSGLALLTARLTSEKPSRSWAGVIAGLTLGAAILLHVTAVYIILPAVFIALIASRAHDRFWRAWWCGLVIAGLAFALQTIWITDCYLLLNLLQNHAARRFIALAAIVFLAAALLTRLFVLRADSNADGLPDTEPAARQRGLTIIRLASAVLAVVVIAAVLLMYRFRRPDGGLPGLPAWLPNYLGFTDFRSVPALSSRAAAAAALAGFPLLAGARSAWGRWLLIFLVPAALNVGWVINFMFETRRLFMAMVPLMVLSTAALLTVPAAMIARAPTGRLRPSTGVLVRTVLIGAAILALLGVGIRGRTRLYSLWSLRGTYSYYKALGARMHKHGDFVFGEYTQTTAPLEHLSGLPLLSLAWDYRTEDEYRIAEQAILRQVTDHPDRRHLFVAPFDKIVVPGLYAERLFAETLETVALGRMRQAVPRHTVERRTTMHVWRLRPATEAPAVDDVFTRTMTASRLGTAGLANRMPGRTLTLDGQLCDPDSLTPISIAGAPRDSGDQVGYLIFYGPHGAETGLDGLSADDGIRAFDLGAGWQVMEIPGALLSAETTLHLRTSAPIHLFEILVLDRATGGTVRLPPSGQKVEFRIKKVDLRWLRSRSAVALPLPSRGATAWMWGTNGRADNAATTVDFRPRADAVAVRPSQSVDGWQWTVWRMEAEPDRPAGVVWFDLSVTPAWDPGLAGYPADLGMLVERFVIVPDPD